MTRLEIKARNLLKTATLIACFIIILSSTRVLASTVKMSNSGICHTPQSPYYERTKNFKAYASLKQCLDDGGRLPRLTQSSTTNEKPQTATRYNREAFAHWTDDDNDCLNTRQELLVTLSTSRVIMSDNGCRVLRGRWNDPYSGEVILDASQIDVDHVVPLAWAWENGAFNWSADTRRAFANDSVNLFAVKLELNRSKGAKGPYEWLPPNTKFRCQYVTRYLRVMLTYEFTIDARNRIRRLRDELC